jgi:hypothetical protein
MYHSCIRTGLRADHIAATVQPATVRIDARQKCNALRSRLPGPSMGQIMAVSNFMANQDRGRIDRDWMGPACITRWCISTRLRSVSGRCRSHRTRHASKRMSSTVLRCYRLGSASSATREPMPRSKLLWGTEHWVTYCDYCHVHFIYQASAAHGTLL